MDTDSPMKHRPIETIKHELSLALKLVNELHNELEAARQSEAGIAPGDVVRVVPTNGGYVWRRKGEYLVHRVEFMNLTKPVVHGRRRRKDGEFEQRAVWLGTDWEKVT
jgi:hypothetical protein